VLRRRWRTWALHILVFVLAAGAYALAQPKWYLAAASLLPPETDVETSGGVAALAPGVRSVSHMPRTTSLEDVFVAILYSRTVAREAVQKFDLIHAYGVPNEEAAIGLLARHCSAARDKRGVVAVLVEDRSPRRAADLANFYLVALDSYLRDKRLTAGKSLRIFLEGRVREVRDSLTAAEDALKTRAAAEGAISLSAQDEAAADLMARRLNLESKLHILLADRSDQDEDVTRVRGELHSVEQALQAAAPPATLGIRLKRQVRMLDANYTLLSTQLEEARARENRDTPTVSVMDRAEPPQVPSRPKPLMLLGIGLALGLIEATWWVSRKESAPSPPAQTPTA
jgi:uncharacterized protein involved in exopolysaccharide biosynthesis